MHPQIQVHILVSSGKCSTYGRARKTLDLHTKLELEARFEIAELLDNGAKPKSIAKAYNTSIFTVYDIKRNGASRKTKIRKRLTQEDYDLLLPYRNKDYGLLPQDTIDFISIRFDEYDYTDLALVLNTDYQSVYRIIGEQYE